MMFAGQQAIPKTHTVLVLRGGVLGCRLKNGSLDNLVLDSHRPLQPSEQNTKNLHQRQ
jgi:WD repeat-containing protein 19